MRKKKYGVLTGTAAIALILAACGGGDDPEETDTGTTTEDETTEDSGIVELESAVDHGGELIEGGDLNVALVTESAFQGIFSLELYQDTYDATLMAFNVESLFSADENGVLTNDGAVELDFDEEAQVATLTIKDGVTWSDGEPVTTEDLLYSYEVIGHPEYTGIRYDSTFTNIVGMEAYHNEEADTISGIEIVDDSTMTIEFLTVSPQILQSGGGIWGGAMPKHQLEDIPVAELEESDEIRVNPIGFGPFVVENIVPGESVEYVPNEYYWQGEPLLDSIVVQVVPSSGIVAGLEAGTYDIALSMPTDLYPTYEDLPGYTILGKQERSYTYIGFKLGSWDSEIGEVVTDPDAKMADVSLRQAMGYAIDNDAVGAQFYHGLRSRANSAIIPAFEAFYNPDVEGYYFDPELSEELLDEAGYEDLDGDGFRETPEGEELVINFASMAGGDVAEPIAEYYMQSWADVGLNVQLVDGQLLEFNAFYDRVEADDEAIDIYQAAWGTGNDPTPDGLYGRTAAFNYTRWSTEENDDYMAQMVGGILYAPTEDPDEEPEVLADYTDQAWDEDFRINAFYEWQQYFSDQAPIIPTLFRNQVLPVNERVQNFDWSWGVYQSTFNWHQVGVTSETTITE